MNLIHSAVCLAPDWSVFSRQDGTTTDATFCLGSQCCCCLHINLQFLLFTWAPTSSSLPTNALLSSSLFLLTFVWRHQHPSCTMAKPPSNKGSNPQRCLFPATKGKKGKLTDSPSILLQKPHRPNICVENNTGLFLSMPLATFNDPPSAHPRRVPEMPMGNSGACVKPGTTHNGVSGTGMGIKSTMNSTTPKYLSQSYHNNAIQQRSRHLHHLDQLDTAQATVIPKRENMMEFEVSDNSVNSCPSSPSLTNDCMSNAFVPPLYGPSSTYDQLHVSSWTEHCNSPNTNDDINPRLDHATSAALNTSNNLPDNRNPHVSTTLYNIVSSSSAPNSRDFYGTAAQDSPRHAELDLHASNFPRGGSGADQTLFPDVMGRMRSNTMMYTQYLNLHAPVTGDKDLSHPETSVNRKTRPAPPPFNLCRATVRMSDPAEPGPTVQEFGRIVDHPQRGAFSTTHDPQRLPYEARSSRNTYAATHANDPFVDIDGLPSRVRAGAHQKLHTAHLGVRPDALPLSEPRRHVSVPAESSLDESRPERKRTHDDMQGTTSMAKKDAAREREMRKLAMMNHLDTGAKEGQTEEESPPSTSPYANGRKVQKNKG